MGRQSSIIVLVAAAATLAAMPLCAAEYFVSPDGSDAAGVSSSKDSTSTARTGSGMPVIIIHK